MNDPPSCIFDGKVMHADDTSLSNKGETTEDIKTKLMPDLSRICNWLKINKLNLNATYTENWESISYQGGWKFDQESA